MPSPLIPKQVSTENKLESPIILSRGLVGRETNKRLNSIVELKNNFMITNKNLCVNLCMVNRLKHSKQTRVNESQELEINRQVSNKTQVISDSSKTYMFITKVHPTNCCSNTTLTR